MGYRICFSNRRIQEGSLIADCSIEVGPATTSVSITTQFVITYIRALAFTTDGIESLLSNEVYVNLAQLGITPPLTIHLQIMNVTP